MDHLPAAAVVILAAGAGTRMKSRVPKVLHSVAGRTLLSHAIAAGREVNPSRLCVVVRHERDQVAADALAFDDTVLIADQDAVPGTGRAVQCALDKLVEDGVELRGPLVVTASDTPMLDGGILTELLHSHVKEGNAVTVLTTHLANPMGYGRIVRNEGAVVGIVEEKDCSEEERAIREVNAAVYVFEADVLADALRDVGQSNAQGEVYLTDVIRIAHERGLRVQGVAVEDSWTVEGCNDKVQLAALGRE
ncbi:MAG: NTP transferase domain-containing protein, partial [Actinomycetes bacterium]|nr:NTP transferase domain-containing protein [Actinomycetes bacterium]MDX5380568.1 NTP transferase domain-containing protein [Actinomycetes bacterium]MDX5399463.1 NTP transferase domain-containing protein [Actinomycetes bacterium]MDX5450308.1 NTP transferase domain-containing protein [Actinomycetes bacterium]